MFNGIKNGIASRLSPTGEHLSALRADLNDRLRGFGRNREHALQKELEEDFARVLEAWGIQDEAGLPGIIRDLRLRCLILALPAICAAFAAVLAQSRAVMLTLFLIALPCLLGILTAFWRMSVLRRRAFTPFVRWLLTGFFQKRL
jgi:hypothetical protein